MTPLRALLLLAVYLAAEEASCAHLPIRACALGAAAVHSLRPRQCVAAERRGRKKKKASLTMLKDRDLKEQADSGYAEHDTDYGESGQVLLYPKEDKEQANATSADGAEVNGNATTTEAEEPKSAFKGTARSLS